MIRTSFSLRSVLLLCSLGINQAVGSNSVPIVGTFSWTVTIKEEQPSLEPPPFSQERLISALAVVLSEFAQWSLTHVHYCKHVVSAVTAQVNQATQLADSGHPRDAIHSLSDVAQALSIVQNSAQAVRDRKVGKLQSQDHVREVDDAEHRMKELYEKSESLKHEWAQLLQAQERRDEELREKERIHLAEIHRKKTLFTGAYEVLQQAGFSQSLSAKVRYELDQWTGELSQEKEATLSLVIQYGRVSDKSKSSRFSLTKQSYLLNEWGRAYLESGLTELAIITHAAQKNQIQLFQLSYEKAQTFLALSNELLDAGIGLIPVVGSAKDMYEAVTGISVITGKTLDSTERTLAMVGVLSLGSTHYLASSIKILKKFGRKFHSGWKSYISEKRFESSLRHAYNLFILSKKNVPLRWGVWKDLDKVNIGAQIYARVGNLFYKEHAVERMMPNGLIQQGKSIYSRGVPPIVVEHAIKVGSKAPGKFINTVEHVFENVTVITDGSHKIVYTVIKKGN